MPLSRRFFLKRASTWGIGGLLLAGRPSPARSATVQPLPPRTVRIAHLSRREGPLAGMASYAIMGAQLGAEEANVTAGMFGTQVELIIEDAVRPEQVAQTARHLSAQPNLAAIIGALDDPTTVLLSEFGQQQRVVVLNAAARGGSLRGDTCHRHTFHVEPDLAMHAHAVGQWLLQNTWKRWSFVVSGDPLGEEVYHTASRWLHSRGGMEVGRHRSALGQRDYTPILESAARQNAEVIFVTLRGEELLQFLRQFREAGVAAHVAGAPLDMLSLWKAGTERLDGVWATSWYHQLERFSARELNRRFLRRFSKPAEAYAWANWAAVKLIVEGILRRTSADPATLVNYLESSPAFDGHKGKALTFREWNHQLRQPLYVVKARDATPANAWALLEVVAEVPSPAARGKPVWELLDTLGEAKAESTCHLEP
ncbi:MAG: ABC transporter substrate-binding protein [Nitrospinae bacterium]|nr:ABC transporter substrate-binding protein [Nitrospinota bacterium]